MESTSDQPASPEERIERTYTVFSSFAEADAATRAYWHSRTPEERLRHAQYLRRLNYGSRATEPVLRLLRAEAVEYLLVRGWAVIYHGYPRTTKDLDIWIAVNHDKC
jgi:hypothetical protein